MLEPRRWPKGYIGTNHETLGSTLLSVLAALRLPEQVLGADEVQRLKQVEPESWYPIGWLLSTMETLDRSVGHQGLVRTGRRCFEFSHRLRVPYKSAFDVIYGIDEMYRHSNRGQAIGGWAVITFQRGYAEIEKTTPHHCAMEQGILTAALSSAQCPSIVSQSQCFRAGADSCIYTISSALQDERWSGTESGREPRASEAPKTEQR
jgi:hypothetical protein